MLETFVNLINSLADDMLFRQDQIMRMTKTPKQLVKTLRFHSEVSCKQLGAELYSGGGWDDLVPLGRIQQRWFERLLNSSRILQKWFKKVRHGGLPPARACRVSSSKATEH